MKCMLDSEHLGACGLDWPDREASLGDLLQALSAWEIERKSNGNLTAKFGVVAAPNHIVS